MWKRPPQATVETIWDLADRVLGVNGQVRLEDITDATGIPRATVYYYFPGRDAFVAWVVEEELRRAAADVAQIDSSTAGLLQSRRAAQVLVDRWRERPNVAARLLDGMNTAAGIALTDELARRLSPASSRRRPRPGETASAIALATAALGLAVAAAGTTDRRMSTKVIAATLDQLVSTLIHAS